MATRTTAAAVARLRTRPPTGKTSWPLILLTGEAGTGKSYRAAQFTGDERVGRSFFLDLGEGIADEYIQVPGARYDVIDHDGTWVDIIGQVEAVRDLGAEALRKGDKPVLLIVDSMTAEWAMLSQWADTRARRSNNNRKLLEQDPDAEIDITSNYWNDATSRHNRLMGILKTFPGIVIMTALETEKTQFGPGGKPLPNAPKVPKPDGQKRLSADSTAHIRLSRTEEPTVVKLWSAKHGVEPGRDEVKPWRGFTLGALVFDFLGLAAETAQVRDAKQLTADQTDQPRDLSRPVSGILAAKNADVVTWWFGKVEQGGDAHSDATRYLNDDDRAALGLADDTALSVAQLVEKVTAYVAKHGSAPRHEPDEVAAG